MTYIYTMVLFKHVGGFRHRGVLRKRSPQMRSFYQSEVAQGTLDVGAKIMATAVISGSGLIAWVFSLAGVLPQGSIEDYAMAAVFVWCMYDLATELVLEGFRQVEEVLTGR